MRINLNKLTKKHFLFAGLFLTASFALMVSSPKLRMALDTQPGNILPDGGSSVFDASSIANGTGLTDNLLADGSGNYFTFLKYKNGSNVDWHFQKIDSTGARA